MRIVKIETIDGHDLVTYKLNPSIHGHRLILISREANWYGRNLTVSQKNPIDGEVLKNFMKENGIISSNKFEIEAHYMTQTHLDDAFNKINGLYPIDNKELRTEIVKIIIRESLYDGYLCSYPFHEKIKVD